MPYVCTRVFERIVINQDSAVFAGRVELSNEVNTFLATLPNLGDALDVNYSTTVLDAHRISLVAVVCFVHA